MTFRYRITQIFEVSVADEPLFVEWAEQVVPPAVSEQARITSGLMRVAARALHDVPGVRLHESNTSVHRFQPGDGSEQTGLRRP